MKVTHLHSLPVQENLKCLLTLKKDFEPAQKLSDAIAKETEDPHEQKKVTEDLENLRREVDEVIEKTAAQNEILQASLKPWREFHDALPIVKDWIDRATIVNNKDLVISDPIPLQELINEHKV